MPEFILNKPRNRKPPHAYYGLSEFAQGYIEAMFFTNGDTGDEREDLLNELGVERLTKEAVADIARDCERFESSIAYGRSIRDIMNEAEELIPGSESFRYARESLNDTRLGHLFWYARQGHGVTFTDDGDADCLKTLQHEARHFGSADCEVYRGWIYHR